MKPTRMVALNSLYEMDYTQVLGEGASGAVYLGRETQTGQSVAVKVIDMSALTNEVSKYLLQMEIAALQSLNHPNVLKGLEVLKNDTKCFIITELCNGKTLSEIIQRHGPLNQQASLNVLLGILKGYQELIRKKVVHRDMKTSNIMLHNGEAKIIDFGYCQVDGHQRPNRKYNVGSPNYMAPETFDENIYNEKAQIWSIGTIFYEITTGMPLHDGRLLMPENFSRLKQMGIQYPVQTSGLCRHLINWCLSLDSHSRPTCSDLICEIERNISKRSNEPGMQPNIVRPQSASFQKSSSPVFQTFELKARKGSEDQAHLECNRVDRKGSCNGEGSMLPKRNLIIDPNLIFQTREPNVITEVQSPQFRRIRSPNVSKTGISRMVKPNLHQLELSPSVGELHFGRNVMHPSQLPKMVSPTNCSGSNRLR